MFLRRKNGLLCSMSMSTSNEWINFISAIKNSTRIFLTISIRLLVFCGVSKEVAGWITRCRLNKKTKDRLTLSRCLLRRWKKDTESLGSWTYLLELLEEDKRQKSVQNSSWKDILAVKTNFAFSGPNRELRRAKWTNHSALSNWEI